MEKLEVKNVLMDAKKVLMDDQNINNVHYSTNSKRIIVKPNQSKSYLGFKDVFENFTNEYKDIIINGNQYLIVGYDHFNTTIYSLTLKLCVE